MKPIVIICGSTASGKSAVATLLAKEFPAVIINCDSMQVYKEIPIITAQPTEEEQAGIPHKLYGYLSATERCTAGRWVHHAKEEIDKAHHANLLPIIVGGTGFYIRTLMQGIAPIPDTSTEMRKKIAELFETLGKEAFVKLLQELDPQTASQIDLANTQRVIRAMEVFEETGVPLSEWQQKPHQIFYQPEQFQCFFLKPDRQKTYDKCDARFLHMLENGAIEEIKALDEMNLDPTLPAVQAHGIPDIMGYLHGSLSEEDMIRLGQQDVRRYVKRQITWFSHQLDEAEQIEYETVEEAAKKILPMLKTE